MLFFAILGLCLSGALGASLQARQVSSQDCMSMACAQMYSPVCASNHHTYSSRCEFSMAACVMRQSGRLLSVVHEGPCASIGSAPVLPGTGINTGGHVLHAQCDQICDEEVRHVCATDGVVYRNLCLYQRARCEASKNHTSLQIVAYNDTCPTPREVNCEQFQIDTSDLAIEGGVQVQVTCPRTTYHHYVCATNGVTYANECSLCHATQNIGMNVMISHDGVCHGIYQTISNPLLDG